MENAGRKTGSKEVCDEQNLPVFVLISKQIEFGSSFSLV